VAPPEAATISVLVATARKMIPGAEALAMVDLLAEGPLAEGLLAEARLAASLSVLDLSYTKPFARIRCTPKCARRS
jgi:hypothetical protein